MLTSSWIAQSEKCKKMGIYRSSLTKEEKCFKMVITILPI